MTSVPNLSSDPVLAWLTERAALYLERPPAELDPATPLQEYGLDSVYAVAFCGDIEERYGIEIEPTTAWDHPSLAALTGYLRPLLPGTARSAGREG
ncbi:acyl carrier protein [Actinomadura harenae]|uniref:Acyl carrier protein n=1 Tax=Actinomadura harenae TaxID=2483351 RepID=A0A3M2KZ35_9ACTN|nr:acyl carrier protein [Actinomadura harenae]RMI30749.1 acyl carrier protein [Actinomadura harenae]